ncbi:MAG: hypothetical protein LUC40_03210, partial [Oscillospiraceae bacterium]|nr:hypothetical protein [Oscillospiraceae bacterium]
MRAAHSARDLRSQRRFFSNYLFALHYLPGISAEELCGEHFAGAILYRDAEVLKAPAWEHGRGAWRVGFLAPRFSEHAVSYFSTPLIEGICRNLQDGSCAEEVARAGGEIRFFAYSLAAKEEEDFFALRHLSEEICRRTLGDLDAYAAAERIHADEIDLLIDLGGHSAGGETLAILAHRPAKFRATGIGYFNTTGLSCVDAIFSDRDLVRAGEERLFSEQPLYLKRLFAFQPSEEMMR